MLAGRSELLTGNTSRSSPAASYAQQFQTVVDQRSYGNRWKDLRTFPARAPKLSRPREAATCRRHHDPDPWNFTRHIRQFCATYQILLARPVDDQNGGYLCTGVYQHRSLSVAALLGLAVRACLAGRGVPRGPRWSAGVACADDFFE
jgi:hypothetical protein